MTWEEFVARLTEIVRDVADEWEPTDRERGECSLCPAVKATHRLESHYEDCAYRRSVELMREGRSPAGDGQGGNE